jgi:hypothetical protein
MIARHLVNLLGRHIAMRHFVVAENLFIRQLIYFENCRVNWCINNIKNRTQIGLERNGGRGIDLMRF